MYVLRGCVGLLLALVISACVGCSSSSSPQPSRIGDAVFYADKGVTVTAGDKTKSNEGMMRVPPGECDLTVTTSVFSHRVGNMVYYRNYTWTMRPKLQPGQLYRVVTVEERLYIVQPLTGDVFQFQTPGGMPGLFLDGVKRSGNVVKCDPATLKAPPEALAEAIKPMVAGMRNCTSKPDDKGVETESSVRFERCPGAVFLLEARLVNADGQPIMENGKPLLATREISTTDMVDEDEYTLLVPWVNVYAAKKTTNPLYLQMALRDSLGNVRSTAPLQKLP